VVKSPLRKWSLGAGFRIEQESSNGGRGLKTTKVQAFGGSNPSPSIFGFPPLRPAAQLTGNLAGHPPS
jgi:hypothetical protein